MRKYIRVQVPRKIDEFITLSQQIVDTHLAHGASSVLSGLDMLEMIDLNNNAKAFHALFLKLNKDKKIAIQDRNLALGIDAKQYSHTPNTILYYITSIRDFLFGINKGKEQMLGNWTFEVNMSNGFLSVIIPRKANDLLTLAEGIYAKHEADGVDSVLKYFDMAEFGILILAAKENDALAKKLNRDKEMNFQQRNLALGFGNGARNANSKTLLHYVLSCRDVLLGLNKSNEKSLGLWGFYVISSPKSKNTEPNFDLSGTVQSANTQVTLPNAKIQLKTSLTTLETTTDEFGNFEIELYIPKSETATLIVQSENNTSFSQQVAMKPKTALRLVVEV